MHQVQHVVLLADLVLAQRPPKDSSLGGGTPGEASGVGRGCSLLVLSVPVATFLGRALRSWAHSEATGKALAESKAIWVQIVLVLYGIGQAAWALWASVFPPIKPEKCFAPPFHPPLRARHSTSHLHLRSTQKNC